MTVLWGMHDAGVAAFAQLLRASVDGGLFVLTVLLLVRVVPSLPARAVTIAWWLASVRFLVGLTWIAPLPLPVLPPAVADAPAQVLASLQPAPPAEGSWSVVEAQPSDDDATSTASGAAPARQLDPRALAAFAWVGLTSVLVLRTGRRAWQTAGLLREASPPDDRLRTIAGEAAQCIGLPRAPAMLVSHVPAPPQVVWLGRPTVLLACHDVARLDDEALMWLVAHEFLHVKQRDGWWAWGPALAAHLFAFHPLARLAAREFVAARESVCDLGVLQHAGAMPREYGRLLVRLGVARSTRAVATAASSPTVKTLKRRLIMLERWSPDARRLTARAVLVLVLLALGMVPLQLVAMRSGDEAAREAGGLRAFGLASDSVQAPPAAPAPPAPPAPPAYTHETQPVPPPAPPAAPEAPPPPPPPPPMDLTVKGQPVEGWALTSADGGRTMGHWVDGAQRRSHLSGPSFWFRHDGREYVVRDAAVLAEIERALAPMSEVGRRQGEIGRQQGEIGRRQGEVGRQQAQFARQQARESLEKARAAVRDAARHQAVRGGVAGGVQGGVAGGVEDAVKAAEEAVELAHRELERALAEQDEHRHREAAAEGHAEAARDHEELAQQMRQLSEQMRPLADEQAALSREMRRAAAAAMTDLGAILERALASGAAQPATPR